MRRAAHHDRYNFAEAPHRAGKLMSIVSRRWVIQRASAITAGFGVPINAFAYTSSKSAHQLRIVSLDHSLTQQALSVGVVPIAISRPDTYRSSAVEPILPDSVADLGRNVDEPNVELLRELHPDLILLNEGIRAAAGSVLAPVAPLVSSGLELAMERHATLEAAIDAHRRISITLGRVDEGARYRRSVVDRIASTRSSLHGRTGRPLLLLSVIDARHVYVYLRNSIYQVVLDQVGLVNAWQGVTMPLGMAAVGLEQIALLEDAIIAVFEGDRRLNDLIGSPLWRALRPVREGRVVSLPLMWSLGGLPVAERFARHLVPALERLEARHG